MPRTISSLRSSASSFLAEGNNRKPRQISCTNHLLPVIHCMLPSTLTLNRRRRDLSTDQTQETCPNPRVATQKTGCRRSVLKAPSAQITLRRPMTTENHKKHGAHKAPGRERNSKSPRPATHTPANSADSHQKQGSPDVVRDRRRISAL